MADDPKKNYPLPKLHFELDWDGTRIGFTEVSGLDFDPKMIEYLKGGSPTYNKTKQPGLTEYKNITLKRGTFPGNFESFEQWKKNMIFKEEKEKFRRDATIRLLDEEHRPIITWTVARAWPSKVTSTDLKARGNEVAIESMELVHEGLSIVEAKK